jgi:ParB family chromosome partitioning protein
MPKPRKRSTAARKRIRRREARGLGPAESALSLEESEAAPIVAALERSGGRAIAAYREPLTAKPLVVAMLAIGPVEPTPFQRELSPTHTKRLAEKIEEVGAFLDPIIGVVDDEGRFWTPNGRHRLAAARALGLRAIPALVAADPKLAFKILALNTEKAHNLRDRSLEVIRMAQALAEREPGSREADWTAEFESPVFLTLGLLYEENGRFSGGAYQSMLKKVDRFESEKRLGASLRAREGLAARLAQIDARIAKIVQELAKRGFRSPYLKTYVVARLNPV